MMHVPPHAIPHLSKRQSLPQTDNLDLQREFLRINKAEGLVNRSNHHKFDDEQSKTQVNKEIEECVHCESRCNAHCPYEKNTVELYDPSKGKCSKGNAQKHNSKMGKILDGLPMSLGQTQQEQIWHQ